MKFHIKGRTTDQEGAKEANERRLLHELFNLSGRKYEDETCAFRITHDVQVAEGKPGKSWVVSELHFWWVNDGADIKASEPAVHDERELDPKRTVNMDD